ARRAAVTFCHAMFSPLMPFQITPTTGHLKSTDANAITANTSDAQIPYRKYPLASPVNHAIAAQKATPMKPEIAGCMGSLRAKAHTKMMTTTASAAITAGPSPDRLLTGTSTTMGKVVDTKPCQPPVCSSRVCSSMGFLSTLALACEPLPTGLFAVYFLPSTLC